MFRSSCPVAPPVQVDPRKLHSGSVGPRFHSRQATPLHFTRMPERESGRVPPGRAGRFRDYLGAAVMEATASATLER
ncbi:hypothetical protein GCM10010519_68440 [Streptomyces lactacystinicus]